MCYPVFQSEGITVITVVKENVPGLLITMASLQSQTYDQWQSIIVVRESDHSTLAMARQLSRADSRIRVSIQTNSGIYEAMNIGVLESNSQFLWFMNSGDIFMDKNSLRDGVELMSNSNAGFIVGGYKVLGSLSEYKQTVSKLTPLKFAFTRRGGCHQAMIFRTSAIIECGLFNTDYRLAADYELCLKILKLIGGAKSTQIYAIVEPNGRTDQSIISMHREKLSIRNTFFAESAWVIPIGWVWMYLAITKSSLRSRFRGWYNVLI